jgi:hypothetical protein
MNIAARITRVFTVVGSALALSAVLAGLAGASCFTDSTPGGLRPCLAPAVKKAANGTKVVIGSCQGG